jgi:hypothetical protein
MSVRCPDGHTSESTDYCDTCGLPIGAPASSSLDLGAGPTVPAPISPGGIGAPGDEKECPNCQSVVPADDLFCEVCGYDFTTGVMPNPVAAPGGVPVQGDNVVHIRGGGVITEAPGGAAPTTAPADTTLTWVAEVWVDPDWFATQESDEPCPSAGMPVVMPLWDTSVLIGRRSTSRNIHPQVDCGADHGVSRRHAQLTTDGQRWWVEDLQSSNGTFLGKAGAPLPTTPVSPGQRVEFAPGDRVYVGAWTRIVVRKATPDEQ